MTGCQSPLGVAEDAVLDLLDVLTGWCPPHLKAHRALNAVREARIEQAHAEGRGDPAVQDET